MTSNHVVTVKRSGEGVIGVCSCRVKQMTPVATRADAEAWNLTHLLEVARIKLAKPLSTPNYLAYLREMEADTRRPRAEREQWKQLADEIETRLRPSKSRYDTGVETEPLF